MLKNIIITDLAAKQINYIKDQEKNDSPFFR